MTARVETRTEDGAMHIALSGEIDLANAAAVEDQIREAVSHRPETVSVDLTDLTYMDSAGIRVLFTLASRLKPLRIILKLIVPLDSPTRRLIELSGFESLASLQPQSH
jgi:anti-anti-sigma factor